MDIRSLTPDFAVSPQISVADIATIADAGFRTIICNRPDAEIPPSHHAQAIEAAATKAGLGFILMPATHQTLTHDLINAQSAQMSAAEGPFLAYCASGTRSSIIWSYTQAGALATEDIIAATAQAGYDLAGMRSALDQLATRS